MTDKGYVLLSCVERKKKKKKTKQRGHTCNDVFLKVNADMVVFLVAPQQPTLKISRGWSNLECTTRETLQQLLLATDSPQHVNEWHA